MCKPTLAPTPLNVPTNGNNKAVAKHYTKATATEPRKARDVFKACSQLLRFHNHHNFLIVVIGTYFFESPVIFSLRWAGDLLLQYISFGVCIVGGIYVLNALTDAEEDRLHPVKRFRPIPSGFLSFKEGVCYMLGLWFAGFAFSLLSNRSTKFWPIYLAFILVNVLYSCVVKRQLRPELHFLIGITCPMRIYLGAVISNTTVPPLCLVMAALFMFSVQWTKKKMECKKLQDHHPCFQPRNLTFEVVCLSAAFVAILFQYPKNLEFSTATLLAFFGFVFASNVNPLIASLTIGADLLLRTSQ